MAKPNKKTEEKLAFGSNDAQKAKVAKKLIGKATRDSLSKTVSVEIIMVKTHRLYGKRFAQNNKILAHTENEIKKGQLVTIKESRPFSKKVSWEVVETR